MTGIICITGASSGFGEAIARKFSEKKWNCILIARRLDRLEKLKSELEFQYGNTILPIKLDVVDNDSVFQIISSLSNDWQKIDVLINNAGLAHTPKLFDEFPMENIYQMIDVNIKGVINISKAVIPLMKKHKKSTKTQGHIINIGSIVGDSLYKTGSIYCMTKKAVQVLSSGQRIDLLQDRIKVTAVNPGRTKTEIALVMFDGDKKKAEDNYKDYEPLSPQDIADAVLYCVTAPDNVCIDVLTITPLSQANMQYFYKENI